MALPSPFSPGRFDGEVALVTGGGTGIGRAVCLELSRRGATVVVAGRRRDRLESVVSEITGAGGRATALPFDVADEEATRDAIAKLIAEFGRLDLVLANAGYGVNGRIWEVSHAQWQRQMDVNVFGLLHTVRHTMPHLLHSKGRLGLVGSVVAFISTPYAGPYTASKAVVRVLGETLALELQGTGVTCTTLHPGFVHSEIGQVDNEGQFRPERTDRRPQRFMWRAEDAARVMVDALHERERERVFTGHGQFAAFLGRHFPGLSHFVLSRARGLRPKES
jgi:NAD(P)-dependent dehydrogenase (short-subunit alcohol dehydrogenase family)